MLFNAKEKFRLRESTVKPYRDREPQWGPLGYVTYKRTYARTVAEPGQPERTEEWWETVRRVVEGCYTVQMNHCKSLHLPWDMDRAQESAKEMFRLMFEMKFLPPGRGLWAMGCDWLYERGSAALNNPLHPDTRILTRDQGWVPLGELEGQEVTVLTNTKLYGRDGGKGTAANPKWVTARVSHRELHPCVRITYRSREGVSYTVVASRNHRWSRRRSHKSAWETVTSEELRIGDYLPRTRPPRYYKLSMAGAQHGFFFGDGTRSNGELHVFDEAKLAVMESLFAYSDAGVRSGVGDGHRVVRQCPLAWGSLPEGGYRSDPRYVYGFLAGYFAADGHLSDDGVATLSSSCLATLSAVKDLLESVGIQASDPRLCSESSNFKEERELWSLRIATGDLSEDFFLRSDHRATYLTLGEERSNDWLRVASVEPLSEPQEVLCATVPEYEQFVIEGFCLTRNCAFVSTKNIKTEFAEPFCFLMDMSMLGVGVAFDCEGAETVRIVQPKVGKDTYVIPDSKEGWVEALRKVLTPYVGEGKLPAGFDFSEIRPAGTPIRTFGGIAPGPGPLKECLEKIRVILDKVVGRKITSTDIVDLMNIIGKCVVAGGVRRCLPEGTEVHTRRGLLPIEDVSVGDEVRTTEGWRKVVENVYQGRQPVVDIRTQLGDFRCTPQHRMKVFTGLDSFAWKRACDLVPGDRLVFHNAVEESGEETALPAWSYDRPKHSTTCKDIVVPHLDTDMAWFLGYLHGNGYVNAKEVSVSVPATRLNVVRAVEDALSRFGVKVFRTEATEEDDSVKVRVKSRQLALYLGQFKQANTAMRVPDCIKRGRGSLRAAYLGGLYDSDGTAENRPVLLATSVYPSFLREVQNLAATLGVATRLAPKTAKGRKPQWKPLYLLTVVGERFTERIEAWAERYSLKFQRNAVSRRSQNDYGYPADWVVSEGVKYGKHWDRKCRQMTERTLERATGTERTVTPVEVFSVEPVEGEEETYDLSVEGNHEFVVGPGLVSHNTAELALGLADDPEYLRLKDPETNGDKLREWRWASNNSILAKLGMDYTKVGRQTAQNGEPGYFWLENARAYGRMKDPADYRDAEVMGTNPCCEQSLESYEACVDGSTLIHTKTGVSTLKDLVGREVEVWNGVAWSKVVPRQTGSGRELFRVHLSDGSRLDCTANHGWSVRPKGKRKFRRVETRDLAPGDRVSAFALPEGAGGRFEPYAYEYGVFLGDGHFDNGKPVVTLCGAKTALAQTALAGTPYKPYHPEGYADPTRRVSFSGILDKERCRSLKARNGLPGFVLGMDAESIRAFVAGWIDTDGSVVDQGQTQAYRLYGSEADLLDLQVLLRRIGVNHASVTLFARAGEETNKGVRNHDLWYLHIPSFECRGIPTVLKRAERIGPRYRANNAFPGGAPVDRARKQHVVRVERLPGLHDTFCFDEPERHMGVFGNALTYQCNLVETFPSRHDSFEEYKRTLKFAYLYAKTVTLIPTHNERTNAIMLRNRRIGLSQSGIVESFRKIGRREHLRWCDEGYAYVTELDKIYSRWLCIPASIKKTTVKPSGTVSLLPGVTPGIHYPHSEYYLRRIRVQVQSPLWRAIQKAGYPVEESVYGDGTMVCTFPVHEKNYDRAKHEVSIWEQVENAALMQYYWSDNQVSVTVTFRPEEAKDIPHILELFEHRLKGISFLPLKDHGYAQAPYEEIDRETFEALTANLRPLDFSEVDRVEETEKFCTTDSCEIRSCRDAAEHAEKPSVAANA